ncbi:hypothetical protein [Dickeya lacustris]|uniref:Uncharacterized protein n=1 Tax=Dickeya lacustris TaxID=2259638 RepID=A0ABY8G4S8_9GAMM|nr:hypothetical protein [Dickeya lacustris]WFN54938.1 hypothetical protein O1Q98_14965 [Dickeya lacustris]
MTIEIRQLTIYANVTHCGDAPTQATDDAAHTPPAATGQDDPAAPPSDEAIHQPQAEPRER